MKADFIFIAGFDSGLTAVEATALLEYSFRKTASLIHHPSWADGPRLRNNYAHFGLGLFC